MKVWVKFNAGFQHCPPDFNFAPPDLAKLATPLLHNIVKSNKNTKGKLCYPKRKLLDFFDLFGLLMKATISIEIKFDIM